MDALYQKLQVWQKAMDLAVDVYKLSEELPKDQIYKLSGQMQRCAISIPSNIAEGNQRKSPKDYAHYLTIAQGSAAELQTQLLLSDRLKFVKSHELYLKCLDTIDDIRKMLSGLHHKVLTFGTHQ